MNIVALIGRLTHDPELRYPASGKGVANFTLAVDRPFRNREGEREADFVRIVVWDKLAERCTEYLQKGRQVAISGRLQVRSYDDKEGVRRTIAEVVASNVKFLGGKQQGGDQLRNDRPRNDNVPF